MSSPLAFTALPVFAHRQEILNAVRDNSIVILTGETGSGKTTGLARILLEAGYSDVVITQPRITAATSVAEYVAKSLGEPVGQRVGYHSSLNRVTSPQTRVVFRTDGLQLARETHGDGIADREDAVIVIDEHHERSVNIDTLVAVLLQRLKNGAKFRLVFSSATAEVARLMNLLAPLVGYVPHVHIEGRTFPVRFEQAGSTDLIPITTQQLKAGRNVLVFLPGKREIETVTEVLLRAKLDVEVIPLYADLSKEEKDRAFAAYTRPKVVVATNVAQTSITIPDIDVVVDSGLERTPTFSKRGVPGLMMANTSQADCRQRMGRAGRTKPGVYFLCGAPLANRPAFPQPEIHHSNLDTIVLRLAQAKLKPETLLWLDPPYRRHVALARKRLAMLGAVKGPQDKIKLTPTGEQMLGYPLDAAYARMMVEAHRRDVVTDMLALVAAASVGGILNPQEPRFHGRSCDSDLLDQRDLFLGAALDWRANPGQTEAELATKLADLGLVPRRFHRAWDLYQVLCAREGIEPLSRLATLDRQKNLLACVAAGLWPNGLWRVEGRHGLADEGEPRLISKSSCANAEGNLVVAEPFDLDDMCLLQNLSKVSPKMLDQIIPGGRAALATWGLQLPLPPSRPSGRSRGKAHNRRNGRRQ